MTVLMRALNLSNNFITWTSTSPDYEGTNAPETIQSDSAIVVADTGGSTIENIGKLGLEYDPVGLWLFNGNLNDSSGNDFNVSGTPSYVTNLNGPTIPQSAVYGGIIWTRPSRDAALATTGAITIETCGVFYPAGTQHIVSLGSPESIDDEPHNTNYSLAITTNTITMLWETGSGTNITCISDVYSIPDGVPCHIVFTRSASNPATANFYVNGINCGIKSGTAATGCTDSSCLLRIGGHNAGTSTLLSGTKLFSLKIIAAELTPTQVIGEYNRVLGGKVITYPVM